MTNFSPKTLDTESKNDNQFPMKKTTSILYTNFGCIQNIFQQVFLQKTCNRAIFDNLQVFWQFLLFIQKYESKNNPDTSIPKEGDCNVLYIAFGWGSKIFWWFLCDENRSIRKNFQK